MYSICCTYRANGLLDGVCYSNKGAQPKLCRLMAKQYRRQLDWSGSMLRSWGAIPVMCWLHIKFNGQDVLARVRSAVSAVAELT